MTGFVVAMFLTLWAHLLHLLHVFLTHCCTYIAVLHIYEVMKFSRFLLVWRLDVGAERLPYLVDILGA
jgi:hypothetical protein